MSRKPFTHLVNSTPFSAGPSLHPPPLKRGYAALPGTLSWAFAAHLLVSGEAFSAQAPGGARVTA